VERAAQALGVSAAAAQRDFDELARQQMLMAGRADQVVMTAGSAKVGRRAFARICAAAEVDILVTDTGIAPTTAKLADAGVKVVTA
jgi:DeoR family transcriptional regulator, aga operon transcriptional repressor